MIILQHGLEWEGLKMSQEREINALNGWVMVLVALLLIFGGVGLLVMSNSHVSYRGDPDAVLVIFGLSAIAFGSFHFFGFFTLQPNEAQVLVLFGSYKGTVRQSGFHWTNPFKLPFLKHAKNFHLHFYWHISDFI